MKILVCVFTLLSDFTSLIIPLLPYWVQPKVKVEKGKEREYSGNKAQNV